MLEIRNLTKIYRSKTGESVRALDNVSIAFPESGMVFILGKSGSGKSTLLNVMGGLDSYDSGEFVIKGKSSEEFGGSDFDAYRNTFIGFIFQEYNVLDDFTVGANIALALELQGKKATTEKVNEILTQVDLSDYAKRKPNELSGGQKQRVAIARALVKEPQIIMADEPTGALDSNTGKQIFDTLKQLSREKLVLVVSHDRDFAERYADRIIELADGKIISDVTKHEHESETLSEGIDRIGGSILKIKGGYRLTQSDLEMINDYLASHTEDILLSGDGRVNEELRSVVGISERGTTAVFETTDAEQDYPLKQYTKADSKFIRSSLPLKNAFRMGASGLKHKKFRLFMTIFLSLIAFAMFGISDTMGAYDKIVATTESLMDSGVKNASVTVGVKHSVTYDGDQSYVSFYDENLNASDIAYLREKTGLNFVPVFTGSSYSGYYSGMYITDQMTNYQECPVYSGKMQGLVDMSAEELAQAGFEITGRMPEKAGEIAITELMFRQFNEFGFQNHTFDESVAAGQLTANGTEKNSILGKHITITNGIEGIDENGYSFEIVGVVDTLFDYARYEEYLPVDEDELVLQENNALKDLVMRMELRSELAYGFHNLGFVKNEDIETLWRSSDMVEQELSTPMDGWGSFLFIAVTRPSSAVEEIEITESVWGIADGSVLNKLDITWFDGRTEHTLKGNEAIIPSRMVAELSGDAIGDITFEWYENDYEKEISLGACDLKIVGTYDSNTYAFGDMIISEALVTYYEQWYDEQSAEYGYNEVVAEHEEGPWSFAVAPLGDDRSVVRTLVNMSYDESENLQFKLQNSVMDTLDTFNVFIEVGAKVFLYVGIAFAVFAALLLMNFIGTSISYKKREIGILRAVGARSSDVFKIFFSEALIIALINFVLSTAAVVAAVVITNTTMHNSGINVTLLNYGPRQFILMLLISIGVALLASFLPVYNIARRKPVDAIKDR